ncbi:MAG: hypothetical protein H8D23_37310 [Candidatus Brocadiales bacterium]|nr:hypothetical protein [Candidatus Brocadiales bacterium]
MNNWQPKAIISEVAVRKLREENKNLNIYNAVLEQKIVIRERIMAEQKEDNERLLNKDMAWLKSDVELREENEKLKEEIVVVINRDIERFRQCEKLKAELENIKPMGKEYW